MRIGVNGRLLQGPATGISRYIRELYRALAVSTEADEYVFFQSAAGIDSPGAEITIAPAWLPTPAFDLGAVGFLAAQANVDVVHGPSSLLPLRVRRGTRRVVTIHDLSFIKLPAHHNQSRVFSTYYRHAVGASLRVADAVLADSSHTARDIQETYGVSEDRVHVVPLAVRVDTRPIPARLPALVGPYYFSLCTHPRRKNIVRTIEAIAAAGSSLADLTYVVAGFLVDRQVRELEDIVRRLHLQDRVVLLGYLSEEELRSLYAHAEWLVYPSLYEGFGLPVLEAMAAGCPVIAADNSALPELGSDPRFLVDAYDTSSITDALQRMHALDEPTRQSIREAGRVRAATYTWSATANQTKGVLRAS